MTLVKKPVTGMKDILPEEMEIRDYLIGIIKEVYKSYGFTPIETPAVESIGNLISNQGGDNEKLIFRILKRGEKLRLEEGVSVEDISDIGLRYDLTLPLARYYAANSAQLPSPFKAVQIGSVWRADRPQKGRYRQFTQCDIDIIGEAGALAEIELILATSAALAKLCPNHRFKVRINDREILRAMASYAGFAEEETEKVFIILDKMDKIGKEGVQKELREAGCQASSIERYTELFESPDGGKEAADALMQRLGAALDSETKDRFLYIMDTVLSCSDSKFDLVFDPTLVRGMGYYTGTVFEVSMEGFSGSVAGGGRYDKMIGRFTGKDTPACGFSIGFERIIGILTDAGYRIPEVPEKIAYLYEKGIEKERISAIIREASEERKGGKQVLFAMMNKNKKFQKEQLKASGYTQFKEFYKEALK